MILYGNGVYKDEKYIDPKNPDWTNYSISDTLNSAIIDSIKVELSGGNAVFKPGKTYFNLFNLTAK